MRFLPRGKLILRDIVGDPFLEQLDQMYSQPIGSREDGLQRSDTMMAGFYIQHNTSIGHPLLRLGNPVRNRQYLPALGQRDRARNGVRLRRDQTV